MTPRQIARDVGGWLWGLAQGGFNEEQTISQIIVDAVIGMIPIVGDVTAARDILAVVIRLAKYPERRDDIPEWIALVIGILALIPFLGGAIKGVLRIALRAGTNGNDAARLLAECIQLLSRVGNGNAVQYIRNINLESHTAEVRRLFANLTGRIYSVANSAQRRLGRVAPARVTQTLEQLKQGLVAIRGLGDRMIPLAIRELSQRLRIVQQQLYQGEWNQIPSSLRSRTRRPEAGVVERPRRVGPVRPRFPQNTLQNYVHRPGWPDLRRGRHAGDRYQSIRAFSGPMRAVEIPEGTILRRVINSSNPQHARYWWLRDMPANGRRWREDYAVLESWGGNGEWIEFRVPAPGLRAWEGRCASMTDTNPSSPTYGQHLPGGGTQLLIDFEFPFNQRMVDRVNRLRRRRTNWTDLSGIGVPGRDTHATRLTPPTRRERVGPYPRVTRGSAAGVRANANNQRRRR